MPILGRLLSRGLIILWIITLVIGTISFFVALRDIGVENVVALFRRQLHDQDMLNRTSTESTRTKIVEGVSFGNFALGASFDSTKERFGKPFESADRLSNDVTRYNWDNGDNSSWWVFVDTKSQRVVAVVFSPPIDIFAELSGTPAAFAKTEETLKNVPFETMKGARYGHSLDTIEAIYGQPPKTYFKPGYGVFTYYYPNERVEFLFDCVQKRDPKKSCPTYSEKVEQIRIYAEGWPPDKVWGSGYGKK